MLNIVDKKYAEYEKKLKNMNFIFKRNLAICSMARTISLLEIFQKTDDLKELTVFNKVLQEICESIRYNISLNLKEYCNLCERLSEIASSQKEYEGMNKIEQIICDRSYMFLEYWFYFLQINFINGQTDNTDFARFVLFPAELIKEILSSLNYQKQYGEIQKIIDENRQMLVEIALIEEEMEDLKKEPRNFEKHINSDLKYNMLNGLI